MIIIIYSFTLVGLEIFAYKIKFNEDDEYDLEDGTSPRINYDGFMNAYLATFIIFQGDEW